MRKVSLVLAIVLIFTCIAVPVSAATPRAVTIVPGISFNGTTALCEVRIVGNQITDDLDATIRLYRGNVLVTSWTTEGTGYLVFSKTATVLRGYTYKLTVDLTINGEACSTVYTTGTCS